MADNTSSSTSSSDDLLTLHLTVPGLQGSPRIPLPVSKDVTSTQLRILVSNATSIPTPSLRLIFRGRMIADNDSQMAVTEFKLEHGSVLHCMGKPNAAAGATPPGTGGSSAAASSSSLSSTQPAAQPAAVSSTPALASGSLSTASATAAVASAPSPAAGTLSMALLELRRNNSDAAYRTAVTTLDKILSNIVNYPMEDKYRNLKVNNPAFQRRFGALHGAEGVMVACGFVRQDLRPPGSNDSNDSSAATEEPHYVLHASAEGWPKLLEAHDTVKGEVARVSNVSTQAAAAPSHPSAIPSMGGMGGASPAESQAFQSLMADPANLQRMFQNPMVQSMMRNDPRVNSNPMMRQIMDELANNPMAAQEMAAMMSDPTVRSMMMRMGQQHGGAGMGGAGAPLGFPPGRPAGGAPSQQQRQPQQQPQASDEDLTEEEMIAEAIRRSLQDGA